ncbi:hypothetical protein NR798_09880 [Archangium gephyra]|uniref:hypothetical protein n=1 Tax=Archangium gephyra TaxID=48 RepID=UPI0035D3DBD5
MKMRWMAVAVVALMASACGGTVEEESTAQPPTEQVGPGCGGIYCPSGWICCGANLCCVIV